MSYIFNIRFLYFVVPFNLIFLNGLIVSKDFFWKELAWKTPQYLFSYSDEFVKRGFVGTIFEQLNIEVSQMSIILFSIFIANLFFILFFILVSKAFKESKQYFNIFMILFLLSPLTILRFGYDIGRFDLVNLLIFTSIILIFISENIKNKAIYIGSLVAIALLVHEAFLFIHLPIILAIALYENYQNKFSKSEIFIVLLFAFIVLISLFLFGKVDYPTTIENIKQQEIILANYEYSEYFNSAFKVWNWTLIDNYKLAKGFKISFFSFLLVLPLIFLYFYLYHNFLKKENSFIYKIVFFSFLGILPLLFLAIDYGRWTSLIITNLFFISLYLINKNGLEKVQITKKDKVILTLVLLHFLIGPIQTMSFYLTW